MHFIVKYLKSYSLLNPILVFLYKSVHNNYVYLKQQPLIINKTQHLSLCQSFTLLGYYSNIQLITLIGHTRLQMYIRS